MGFVWLFEYIDARSFVCPVRLCTQSEVPSVCQNVSCVDPSYCERARHHLRWECIYFAFETAISLSGLHERFKAVKSFYANEIGLRDL